MTSFDIDYFCSFIQQCDGGTQGSPSRARAIGPLQVRLFSCLYKKAREVHYHAQRRELQERRLLGRLPKQWSISTRTVGKLGMLLLKLGTWLKQLEQPATVVDDRV